MLPRYTESEDYSIRVHDLLVHLCLRCRHVSIRYRLSVPITLWPHFKLSWRCHGVQRWITMDPSPQGLNWPWPMTFIWQGKFRGFLSKCCFFCFSFIYGFCSCTLTLTLLLYIKKVLLSQKLKSHCLVQCMNLYQNTMNLNEKYRIKVIRVIFERNKKIWLCFLRQN